MGKEKIKTHEVVTHIVKFLLPNELPVMDTEHTLVEGDVVEFVLSQILAMPTYLRIPYQIALHMFNLLPILICGKVFICLDKNNQKKYIALWNKSPVSMMRNFIKLICSCALLQYYDHPVILKYLESKEHEKSSCE